MFSEGPGANTRDPMVLRYGPAFILYDSAFPGGAGAVYARTSYDLRTWSASRKVASGGAAGKGPFSAECPFVVAKDGYYYLFRTQQYGDPSVTRVYRSPDPMNFGIDDDRYLIAQLPVAAPEIVLYREQWYLAATMTSLQGIRMARLAWDP
jgi:beta-xylosidase